jgi:hypothetical protein
MMMNLNNMNALDRYSSSPLFTILVVVIIGV